MAILITGGAGYIGSHTALALLNENKNIVILDSLVNSSYESIQRIKKLSGRELFFYKGDIRDASILRNIFTEHEITDVIHFAGLKSVNESVREPLNYYDNNINGTMVLVNEMIKNKINNIIFSSSATVYGNPEKIPLDEKCKVGGTTNPYGYSKLIVENILSDITKSNPRFNVTCLRYFNPVGAHPSGLIGESPNGMPNNLMPYLSSVAIGKYPKLSIYGGDYNTKDGTGVRDYIHVMDLAEGHVAALNKKWDAPSFRIYNLGTGNGYSVLEMVNTFIRITGREVIYEIVSRRPGDVAECWSNPSAAEKDLYWKAKYNLQQMIEDTWRWQENNPNGFSEH